MRESWLKMEMLHLPLSLGTEKGSGSQPWATSMSPIPKTQEKERTKAHYRYPVPELGQEILWGCAQFHKKWKNLGWLFPIHREPSSLLLGKGDMTGWGWRSGLSTFCETVSLNLWSPCEPDMVVWNCDPTSPVLRWEAKAGEPPEALGPATPEYAVCWGLRKTEGDYQHLPPDLCMHAMHT